MPTMKITTPTRRQKIQPARKQDFTELLGAADGIAK